MRRLLALDTSTWWGSVALVECSGDRVPQVVAEIGERVDDSHAERILDWIGRLLAEAGWSKTAVDAYAATRGPGSFTGVRVGLGTIRGLGLASAKPCFGITTLEAIAEAAGPSERHRLAVMDAGRGELYAACFDARSSPPTEREPPWLASAPSVLERAVADNCLVLQGPGTRIDPLYGLDPAALVAAPERLAGAAGCLACRRLDTDAGLFAPLYIRPPDALLKRPRS